MKTLLINRSETLRKWLAHLLCFTLFFMIVIGLSACGDNGEKDKDIFGFEGGSKDKILSIEVINTQNESLQFKTNETQSIFQSEVKRPTLLFFLSKSCQECQDELLHILDLHNKYQEFLSIIAISPKEDLETLQKEIDKTNPRFKLYTQTDDKNLLGFLNKDDKQSYIALYDRQGEKFADYTGLVPEEMIEKDIIYQIQDQLDAKAQSEIQMLPQDGMQNPQENPVNDPQTQEGK